MRIAHLISTYLPVVGGAQICVHNIAQRHVRDGHQVVIVAPHEFKKKSMGQYSKEGLFRATIFLLKHVFPLGRLYLLYQIRRLQKKYDFDVWQVTIGFPFGVAVVEYLKKNRIPCVLRCTGDDIQTLPDVGYGVRLNKKIDQLIRAHYKYFDAFVAISQTMKNDFLSLEVDEKKISVISNGVDCKRFVSSTEKKVLRERLGLPLDKEIILTVGRNHPKKGFNLIPKIMKILLEKRIDFLWILVGEGSDEIALLAQKQGVSDYFHAQTTLGLNQGGDVFPSEELIAYYLSADIFAFPTFIETFGIVVIEAMAAGLPVVTTQAQGVDEIVEDGKTGFKTSIGAVNSFAACLETLLSDKEIYNRMKNCVIEESGKYDWEQVAEKYFEVYENVVGVEKC